MRTRNEGLDDNKSRGISIACKDLIVGKNEQGLKPSKYIDIMCQDAAGCDAFDERKYTLDKGIDSLFLQTKANYFSLELGSASSINMHWLSFAILKKAL